MATAAVPGDIFLAKLERREKRERYLAQFPRVIVRIDASETRGKDMERAIRKAMRRLGGFKGRIYYVDVADPKDTGLFETLAPWGREYALTHAVADYPRFVQGLGTVPGIISLERVGPGWRGLRGKLYRQNVCTSQSWDRRRRDLKSYRSHLSCLEVSHGEHKNRPWPQPDREGAPTIGHCVTELIVGTSNLSQGGFLNFSYERDEAPSVHEALKTLEQLVNKANRWKSPNAVVEIPSIFNSSAFQTDLRMDEKGKRLFRLKFWTLIEPERTTLDWRFYLREI